MFLVKRLRTIDLAKKRPKKFTPIYMYSLELPLYGLNIKRAVSS